jgi:pilus assembly protein Flp/PilA
MDIYSAFKGLAFFLRTRIASERGATAVEYGIMASLIAAVIIIAVVFLGQSTNDKFVCTKDSITAKTSQC